MRQGALQSYFSTFGEIDPQTAIAQLVRRISSSEPATAFAWASSVANPSQRSSLLESTFPCWRKLDAPAARTAIQATDWPDDEKTRWLDKVK